MAQDQPPNRLLEDEEITPEDLELANGRRLADPPGGAGHHTDLAVHGRMLAPVAEPKARIPTARMLTLMPLTARGWGYPRWPAEETAAGGLAWALAGALRA